MLKINIVYNYLHLSFPFKHIKTIRYKTDIQHITKISTTIILICAFTRGAKHNKKAKNI